MRPKSKRRLIGGSALEAHRSIFGDEAKDEAVTMAARTTAKDSTRPNSTGSTAVWKTIGIEVVQHLGGPTFL